MQGESFQGTCNCVCVHWDRTQGLWLLQTHSAGWTNEPWSWESISVFNFAFPSRCFEKMAYIEILTTNERADALFPWRWALLSTSVFWFISGAMGNVEAAKKWTGSIWRCIWTRCLCSCLSLRLAWVKNQQVIGPVDPWQNVRPVWISIEIWFEFQGNNLSLCWLILKELVG